MTHTKALLAALLATVSLSGCALMNPTAIHELKPNQAYVVDTDASRRAILVVPRPDGHGVYVCAEPSPDVALQLTDQILTQAALSNPNVSAEVQVQFATTVVELAKRSQTLMFLRESMFRLCEQSINQSLSSDQVMTLYEDAMKTALTLAQAELAQQQASQTKSMADLARALQDPQIRALWQQMFGQAPVIAASLPGAGPDAGTTK
ncbi:MAG: hypothetical protein ACRDHZ_25430 [Ktedonobacteraceae bacterium]